MRVRKVSSNDVKLYDLTQVKLKTAGNTSVIQFTAGNNKSCPVRNLSKDTCLDTKTGEVKPKKKSENRYEYPKSVRINTMLNMIDNSNSRGSNPDIFAGIHDRNIGSSIWLCGNI